ncbi:non-ribosomal peptide synthetase [Niastella populi]|uniref:Carrier domain-containing protein n=1 Tax=Niastella populi TaxID=550983 RepID=A0A1V9EFZ2_9BACT|nr:non-ribosomal peptide synthetase [Niastella populi]OQP45033.1 hypothetical protein A4R26_32450 [Niastella populi]
MVEKIHLTGKDFQEHVNFWKNYLAGFHEGFVFRKNKDAVQGKNTALHVCNLLPNEWGVITNLVKDNDSGIFVCVLGALGIVLKKYLSVDRVTINSPLFQVQRQNNRYIPLILETASDCSLRTYLNNITTTIRQCYTYQDLPLEQITWEEIPVTSNVLIKYNSIHKETGNEPYDLVIEIQKEADGIKILFHYDSAAFDASFIARFSKHIQNVIAAMTNVDNTLGAIEILDSNEREELLITFNNTVRDEMHFPTVISLFEQRVREYPEVIALTYNDIQLSYAALNEKVNRMAHHLVRHFNIRSNDVVALMSYTSENWVIAMLGILKAGGCYLPIDPDLPHERKRFLLRDAGAVLLVTDSASFFQMSDFPGKAFLLDIELDGLEGSADNTAWNEDAAALAYTIYTSGTTGRPKGVMLGHDSLVNMVSDQIRQFEITATDKVLQFASVSFDASVSEIFMALCAGARLVLIDRMIIQDEVAFMKFLRAAEISVLTLPPSYLSVIRWDEFSFLRVIISAGEKLNTDAALYLSSQVNYFNAYGPTEYTVCATINRIRPGMSREEAESIGRPIANATVYILNADRQPVPIEVAGELYLGGIGVAKGYSNLPELTAEKFIPDPFKNVPDARLYRTGDMGKWMPDGRIVFLGRRDDQVKLRGFRVELGEIEQAMMQSGLIKQGVLVVKESNSGNKKLMAFVVPGDAFTKKEMIHYLSTRLPEYMVPAVWVELDGMPLTTNGKVDKKKLLELGDAGQKTGEFTAPRNETETKLVNLWKELLNTVQISIYDDFFEMGGDSLLMIRVMSFIRDEFSLNIPMNTMFRFTRISDLSEYIYIAREDTENYDDKESEIFLL